MDITAQDKRAIDEAVEALHYVSRDPSGNQYIQIYADYRDTNESLLQTAYENRNKGFQDKDNSEFALIDHLRETISGWYVDTVGQMESEILERAGFDYADEKADALLDYLRDTYPIEPDYDHFLSQDMCVNIMLGCADESNRDFVAIYEQFNAMLDDDISQEDLAAALEEENGLSWLVKQQGHTMQELMETLHAYIKFFDSEEAKDLSYDGKYNQFCSTHNRFLSSVCQELLNMVNSMNTMTVLTRLSMNDFAAFMQPNKEIVLPKNSMLGIFNPWNGGGSTLDIELEKDLVVPSSLLYDVQIEGAKLSYQYTVDSVYGLVGNAWRQADAVRDVNAVKPVPAKSSLDSLIQSASQRAAEGASAHSQDKGKNTPGQGRA